MIAKSNLSAISLEAAEPPMSFHPFKEGSIFSISLRDIGIDLMYFPGTVFPDIRTLTFASGILYPRRIISIVMYSTSPPASIAAPATALEIGEMYGGTPKAAGSSMYPSIRTTLMLIGVR